MLAWYLSMRVSWVSCWVTHGIADATWLGMMTAEKLAANLRNSFRFEAEAARNLEAVKANPVDDEDEQYERELDAYCVIARARQLYDEAAGSGLEVSEPGRDGRPNRRRIK